MCRTIILLALVSVALCLAPAHACVYLMGEAKDSVAAHPSYTHWNYALRGDNWEGVDASNNSWVCLTGTKQSPMNLMTGLCATGLSSVKTTWNYTPLTSNGSNIGVYNNGHTIQVQWTGTLQSDVTAYAKTKITDVLDPSNSAPGSLTPVKMTPLQFHFHTTSEHMIDGTFSPIEMHIVHSIPQSVLPGCPASGCLSVVGIMMRVSHDLEDGPAALDTIFDTMSMQEGVVEFLSPGEVLDIEGLLPPANMRAYMQYEGSLTTPPCTEGLLWHVLKTPVMISLDQYNAYAAAVGLKNCTSVNGTRRRMQQEHGSHHGHDHHAGHGHAHHYADLIHDVTNFPRGAYSGFVSGEDLRQAGAAVRSLKQQRLARSSSRKMLEGTTSDDEDEGGDWTCEVVAFGWTNRNVMPDNGRTVVSYA